MKKLLLILMVCCCSTAEGVTPCPDDKPLSYEDKCYECDYQEKLGREEIRDKMGCEKCPNRIWTGSICRWNISPDPRKPLVHDNAFEENSLYSREGFIVHSDASIDYTDRYKFVECDVKYPVYTTKENCTLCPERFWEAGRCVTKNTLMHAMHLESAYWNQKRCREENGTDCDKEGSSILDGVEREFYDCDTLKAVFSTKANCNLCPNREYKDHYCLLKSEHYLKGFGYVSCSEKTPFPISSKECAKCPNREMSDGYCVLKESK